MLNLKTVYCQLPACTATKIVEKMLTEKFINYSQIKQGRVKKIY